jgi:hypothetical protein
MNRLAAPSSTCALRGGGARAPSRIEGHAIPIERDDGQMRVARAGQGTVRATTARVVLHGQDAVGFGQEQVVLPWALFRAAPPVLRVRSVRASSPGGVAQRMASTALAAWGVHPPRRSRNERRAGSADRAPCRAAKRLRPSFGSVGTASVPPSRAGHREAVTIAAVPPETAGPR